MKSITKLILLIVLACSCSIFIYYNVESSKPVEIVKDILTEQNEKEQAFLENTNYSVDNPKVILNPYGNSPLTALIIFETSDLTTPTITVRRATFTLILLPLLKQAQEQTQRILLLSGQR